MLILTQPHLRGGTFSSSLQKFQFHTLTRKWCLLIFFYIISRLEKIVVALRAAAEHIGVPVKNCVLVAGSQPGVSAAKMIGMPCVVMRSRCDVSFCIFVAYSTQLKPERCFCGALFICSFSLPFFLLVV